MSVKRTIISQRTVTPARFRRGAALIYITLLMVVLLGFCSLAVDWGHVQACKTQLQRAADAAARGAAPSIGTGLATTQQQAQYWASLNLADGQAVSLDPADIQIGTWSNGTFTSGSSGNAVKISAHRTAARGNAIALLFGQAVGMRTCDVNASAIATYTNSNFGLIGLNSATISGQGNTDSFDSTAGPYSSVTAGNQGSVASNGNIVVSGSGIVHGSAYVGQSGTVTALPGSITGSIGTLTSTLSYPAATIPTDAINEGAVSIGGGTYTVGAGDYYCSSLSISSKATLYCTGAVRIYCSGSFSISGGYISTYLNRPANFQVYIIGSGPVSLGGQADLYATFYAPQASFSQSGKADIYGSIIAQSLNFSGTWQGGVHYDTSLGGNSGTGTISLVK